MQIGPFEEFPDYPPSRLLHIGFFVRSPSRTSPASICGPNGLFTCPPVVRGPAALPNSTVGGRKRRHWCRCGHWASAMTNLLCSQSVSFRRPRASNRHLMMMPDRFPVRRSEPAEPAGTANGHRRDAVAGTPTICSLTRQMTHSGQCVLVSHSMAFPERPGRTPPSSTGGEQQVGATSGAGWLETEPLPMSSRDAGAFTGPFPGAPPLSLRLLTQVLEQMNLDRIGVPADPSEKKAIIQSRREQGDRVHCSKAGIWSTTIIGWLVGQHAGRLRVSRPPTLQRRLQTLRQTQETCSEQPRPGMLLSPGASAGP